MKKMTSAPKKIMPKMYWYTVLLLFHIAMYLHTERVRGGLHMGLLYATYLFI